MRLIHHAGVCRSCFSSILVYGSLDTAAQCLQTLHNPEGCPVLCLKHSSGALFAGLQSGVVIVYGRNQNGEALPRLGGVGGIFVAEMWLMSTLQRRFWLVPKKARSGGNVRGPTLQPDIPSFFL